MSTFLVALAIAVGAFVASALLRIVVDVAHERRAHDWQPCVVCGRCCCGPCREVRRHGKWLAPSGGGYHGCASERDLRRRVSPFTAEQLADTDGD